MVCREVLRLEIGEVVRRWQAGNSQRNIASGTKPIPRWDVHFGGLEDDLKDSTALHLTFTSQLGATDSAV